MRMEVIYMSQKRTKLKDRVLPSYTKGEEIFNMVSHIVGGALAIAALVLCVIFAVIYSDAWGVVGAAIYGATMILLYTMSSIYHGLHPNMAKKVFQVIDHCTIYFLIAGTYTPVTLAGLRPEHPVVAFVIFGVVWAACFVAATLTAIDLEKYQKLSMVCYLFYQANGCLPGIWRNSLFADRWRCLYSRSGIVWNWQEKEIYSLCIPPFCAGRKYFALFYDPVLCYHEIGNRKKSKWRNIK